MRGLFKFLAWLFGLLVAVIVVAAVAIPLYVDPNDYKDEIALLVKKHTGRALDIAGDLKLSIFPWLGVETGRIALGNAPGFGEAPFFEAEEIQVRVKLLPLFKKQVQMDTVVLEGLSVNLARSKEGKTNWDDLLALQAQPAAPATPEAAGPVQPPPVAALALGGLDIRGGRVIWDDRRADRKYVVDKLNLKTGELIPGEPIDMELTLGIDVSDPRISGNLALNGTLTYDLKRQRYAFSPLELEAMLQGEHLPGGKADLVMSAAVDADLIAHTANLTDLSLKTLGTLIEGRLTAAQLDRKLPTVQGQLAVRGEDLPALLKALRRADLAGKIKQPGSAKFALDVAIDADAQAGTAKLSKLAASALGLTLGGDLTITQGNTDNPTISGHLLLEGNELSDLLALAGQEPLGERLKSLHGQTTITGNKRQLKVEPIQLKATLAGPEIPQGKVDVVLAATASADLDKEAVSIPEFGVQGLGLNVQGKLSASGILGAPKYSGNIKVAPFDLRELLQQTGQKLPDMADPRALTQVALDSQIAGTADSVSLSGLTLRLDDTTAKGSVSIAQFADPAVEFMLNLDELNADRYLPPQAKGEAKPAATPEAAAAAAATRLPIETLRALKLKGDLTVAKLTIANAKLSNVRLSINARDGQIALNPVAAHLYEGSYQGDVRLDATGEQPVLSTDSALRGVAIEPLLKDLAGDAKLSGTGDVTARLSARGADPDALKRTLSGTAEFALRNGSYKGINLGHILRQAGALLKGKNPGQVPKETGTDFSELTGTLKIENGMVKNDDLSAKSPAIRVAGAGRANLLTELIDYRIEASVAKTTKGQGGEELTEVGGYTVPVHCKGTFAKPGCAPDFGELTKAAAQKKLKERKQEIVEKVEDKLQEKLGEALGDKLKDALKF